MTTQDNSVTQLLQDWSAGESGALDRLTPLVYDQLQKLARQYMRRERKGHTLQATAIVHEAYFRLVDMQVPWEDRAHFFAVASRLMRRILVDHSKQRRASKRGGGNEITVFKLEEHDAPTDDRQTNPDVIELDDALTKLAAVDERLARMVEIHYFGGLGYEDTAKAFGVSVATLHRDLRAAKAWLAKAMKPDTKHDP